MAEFNAMTVENNIPAIIPTGDRSSVYQHLIRSGQYKRCPGGSESRAPDNSNVWSSDAQAALDCKESDRSVGNY